MNIARIKQELTPPKRGQKTDPARLITSNPSFSEGEVEMESKA